MRRAILILGVLGLAACQMTAAKGPAAGVNPIVGDAIAVTSLDAPVTGAAPVPEDLPADAPLAPLEPAKDAASTPDATTTPAEPTPAEVVPAVPTSPEQEQCERKGDSWRRVGDNQSQACVHITRDAGKQCKRDRDCESVCLARSGTCAPLSPLFGCNEVLQDDGRRMTQCLD